MSQGPGQDPGGGSDSGPPPGSSQELSDLKDQFEQQQVLIAQLKEMIRKNEPSNVTQEKVDEYMNTLSKRRAKKSKKADDGGRKTVEIPASQKISLLRQQVEENKVRLAERGKSQKGIEEMVTQLKAQLDDSQQLIGQSPLNLSLQDPKMEYSENSSAQELYTVLLTKEKRISDLLAKVQKLETNVLDLQENVKEKDSVIDARTKAITLMTENLSRKGKNTLDALDETKEQMRKMQEDFVALESEMKARQMKLLEDLKLKNYEIAELQEVNSSLERQLEEKKENLESEELENLRAENLLLSERIKELENGSEEIAKLKKQLEESNKNMIKVKAQHKSKVKELTKKIESFKKMSDANAEIVKLESENSRLSQKIAELEEEKGSLQLKLVESDSNKSSEATELENALEVQIRDQECSLEEKEKIISILEAEISRSKTEIENLNEKLNGQVKTEMASIQFEEQLERLENEKKQLATEKEENEKEKDNLLETIEQLKKEKQETATKLEHYIHENMELIDKLEKLSAEKVSSAESIEIVENLTQQEKLELEAYQKNLDMVAGSLNKSEENLPQVDLNESVNELTEETSELLQKIELFTVERREVMEKMELLKQENINLNMKIKEIENNRDVLAETYEQLQSEKELLDAKLERIENEKHDNDVGGEENSRLNNTIIELNRTLADLENDNKSLQMKIEHLENAKTELNQIIEKSQKELEVVKNTEWENRRLLESKDNEITKLMKERDNTGSVIANLQKTIKEKEEKYHNITSDLKTKYLNLQKQLDTNSSNFEAITAPLEAKIEELTVKNKEQLGKMKKIAANLKKKTQAYQELEDKFNDSQTKLKTSLQQLQDLETEVSRLQQQIGDKCEEIGVLEQKNVDLQNTIADLKIKNEVSLQQELLLNKENLGSVESSLTAKIQELEMIIETQEAELVKTRTRVNKLEEGISLVEERRLSLERKANELGAQLEEKQITCEEMSKSEDLLEERLAALTAHDEAIERKLQEAVTENQELSGLNQKLIEESGKLKRNTEKLKGRIEELKEQKRVNEDLEIQNENLRKQIHNLENELKTTHEMLEESKNDFDKVNNDWQIQFDEIFNEKSELMAKCEKFAEELSAISEKECGCNNELIEYKIKLEKSETEIRDYEERIQQLTVEKEELEQLRRTIEEKEETIQQLTSVRDEMEQLRRTIDEKEGHIQQLTIEKQDLEQLKLTIKEKEERIQHLTDEREDLDLLKRTIVEKNERIQQLITEREELQHLVRTVEEPKTEPKALASFFDNFGETHQSETKENKNEVIPTFVWSGQTNDPFDFIQRETVQPQDVIMGNTNQELLEKIKTLEFMLYNVEKEKEDALHQCAQLTNELTQLVYEKQPALESQILQESDIIDTPDTCKELKNIEFEATNPPISSTPESGPVVEEPMKAKEAYLCYDDENEPQISKSEARNIFGENDDGWGWGPEEAKLEEEHAQKNDSESLKARIRVLEIERDNHLEEIRQLQVKSGKLIKKLKEFKAKNEALSHQQKSDLDDAIQEELKLQIEQIEKRLKETSNELEKEKSEKALILKKVETLTATNERLLETKEKQDIELLGWQQNYRELNAKLERFEWGDDGFSTTTEEKPNVATTETPEVLAKRIQELNETIKDLTADNEELQALLEEQRKLRVEKTPPPADHEQINELIKKNDELSQKFEEVEQQKGELDELIASKEATITCLNQTLRDVEEEISVLAAELQEKNEEIEALKTSFDAQNLVEEERQRLLSELQEKNAQIENFKLSFNSQNLAEEERQRLFNELKEKNSQIEALTLSLNQYNLAEEERGKLFKQLQQKNAEIDSLKNLANEKAVLFNELQEKNVQINTLRESVDSQIASLKEELDNQIKIAQALLEEKGLLKGSLTAKEAEVLQLTAAMEQMTQEWDLRINQRGNDVAESWKLHLEARESEFGQIEQLLRKEINELEEKTNALVNENNELRKNVDAEIRNEVDRVAALQQQINDRQQHINDLTVALQDKQMELDKEKQILDQVFTFAQELSSSVNRDGTSILKVFKDRENLIVSLQNEIEKIKTRTTEVEDEYNKKLEEVQNLHSLLQEREQTITSLTNQMNEMQNLKDYENENIQNLQQNLQEYQQINSNVTAQLQTKTSQLEAKEREMVDLRHSLEQKQREHDYALESLSQEYKVTINEQLQEIEVLKRRLTENENHYEELLQSKNSDLESVQFELQNHSQVLASKNKEIEDLTTQCVDLQRKIDEQTVLIDEENKQLSELRSIIEEQVLKIEELKKELYEKSNDYDSLIAEMDISRSAIKQSEATSPPQKSEESEDLTEPVSRAELDLALYMLHQRDVRCEELTVELTQLLEERDTLQLRLSNVLREKEELGRKVKEGDSVQAGSSDVEAQPVEATENADHLTSKLSELKTVGYKKDKTIVDEQELRRFQQMSVMQQHRDVVSRLPPEAAARLVDASYTLSRDVQSPSKVLLNWLWGRSTPRVNNI